MLSKLFRWSPLKVALIVMLLMLGLYGYSTFEDPARQGSNSLLAFLDKKWVDFIQRQRGVAEHTPQVAIAAIDTKAIERYGRWPWNRRILGEVVKTLNEYYEVGVIGFDIVFAEPDVRELAAIQQYQQRFASSPLAQLPEGQEYLRFLEAEALRVDGDRYLAEQIAKTKNVVFGYPFLGKNEVGSFDPEGVKRNQERLSLDAIGVLRNANALKEANLPDHFYPALSTEQITGPEANYGFFNVSMDADGVVRRVHTIRSAQGRYYPSLALKMLNIYLGTPIQLVGGEMGVEFVRLGKNFLAPYPDSSFLINYKGPAKTFTHYSVADILDRSIPQEALKDALMLVGVTEVGILDLRVAPVQEDYPGVEVHANLLDNWLTGTYFQYDTNVVIYTLAFILIFGFFAGMVLPKLKLGLGFGIVVVLAVSYTVFQHFCVTKWLIWPSYFYVMITLVACSISVWLYMFFVADRDKRFIKGAFQQYLSPTVIDQLLTNPDLLKLGGEEKVLTAMFSDVAGFSTISEKLTPSELVQLLNEYLTEMSDIIMKYEGTVDKFEGDAIIAFFGAPINYPDHATRAALVCLEMQNRLAELRASWKKDGRPELRQRVGINTGPMVVGNMGSRNRFDYTIMGNSVNLAARLEGTNKVYGIELMMSEMSYEECKDAIEARELDLIRVIGIQKPVRIYQIVCRKGELDHNRRQAFELFAQGLAKYRSQQWEEAEKFFHRVLELLPDGPSQTFLKRCEQFRREPPPQDWDGVYTATSK